MQWLVHNLANALRIIGQNVVVLTKRVKEPDLEIKQLYQLEKFGFAFKGAGRTKLNFLSFLFRLQKICQQYEINVINFHSAAYSGTYLTAYKKFMNGNIPIVATLHGEDIQKLPEINYGYCLDPHWEKKIVKVLKKADAITAISESMRKDIEYLIPNMMPKVHDVPNGIWIDKFLNHKVKQNIHERFNLPDSAKVIISVGRNRIVKGFEYGIKAMDIIRRKFSDVCYVIIGKGTENLLPLVRKFNLNGKVVLPGEMQKREELLDCYRSSDIYLSPSLIEGFSLTNLEALASGLSCIVTDVPGNRDVIKDWYDGIRVTPKSPEAIAEAVSKILSNEQVRERLKENSLK